MLTAKEMKEFEELTNLKSQRKLNPKEYQKYKRLCSKREGKVEAREFKPGNDFSWWSKFLELLGDAINIKANYIPGTPLDAIHMNFTPVGVMKINFRNMYGINSKATDPINIWARDLYLQMFQKYRAISAYSASDLGIALIAGVEVVCTVARLERIYGILNRYDKLNVNKPSVELEALGVSSTDATWLRNHLADFRSDLNILISRAQRLCIPKEMSIIADKLSLLGYEYLDHDNPKAQIIIFDCKYTGFYEDSLLSTGGCIRFEDTTIGNTKFIDTSVGPNDNMFPALEAQINALIGSDSIQKIYADLVTWFGEEQMLRFLPIVSDYLVNPVYSVEILHKIHNIDPVGLANVSGLPTTFQFLPIIPTGMSSADVSTLQGGEYYIYQFDDAIITECASIYGVNPVAWYSNSADARIYPTQTQAVTFLYAAGPTLLDNYHDEFTPEVVTEGMLFKWVVEHVNLNNNGNHCMVYRSLAFEVVETFQLFGITFPSGTITPTTLYSNSQSTNNARQYAGQFALFDWAPLVYVVNNTNTLTGVYGDIDQCVPLYENTKAKAHRAILLSGLKPDLNVKAN